jgi:hypothetical protein
MMFSLICGSDFFKVEVNPNIRNYYGKDIQGKRLLKSMT